MRTERALALRGPILGLSTLLLVLYHTFSPANAGEGDVTLERIKKEGVLRWGADPSGGAPFVFYSPTRPDEVVGFEVAIAERIAQGLGVRSELVRGDWAALVDNLKAGRIDLVLNGLEVTEERTHVVAFSVPYYRFYQQLTVRAEDKEKYRSLEDLKGHRVSVLSGSASVRVLLKEGWNDQLILQYDDSLTPYEEVKLRRATASMAESIIAKYYAAKDAALYNLPKTFAPGVYAAAMRPQDTSLLREVNHVLNDMKRSGELGQIYQRWDIWSDEQKDLGVARGEDVQATALDEGGDLGIGVVLLKLLQAAQYTLLLTFLAMPLALGAGLVLALMQRSGSPLLSWPAAAYVQVVRGTPLLVQIYLFYYTLPQVGQLVSGYLDLTAVGLPSLAALMTWPNFVVGVICLGANYAAYEAEIHRAGLEAVPKGQREAALSLGMSEAQAFRYIVLPQSFRVILPAVLNDLISMLKDSCLVSVIGVQELLTVALGIGKARFAVPQLLLEAAILYLVMSLAADWLGKRLEARLKKGGAVVPKQPAHH